jgi:hypothetical protein
VRENFAPSAIFMTVLRFHRSLLTTTRVLLMAAMLLFAQLGIASHPLHASGKQDGQTVEVTCAFCIAGTHLQSAPSALVLHLDKSVAVVVDDSVHSVCEVLPLVTPQLTRGPPLSTPCV